MSHLSLRGDFVFPLPPDGKFFAGWTWFQASLNPPHPQAPEWACNNDSHSGDVPGPIESTLYGLTRVVITALS